MTGYLEAYRLSRVQAEGEQASSANVLSKREFTSPTPDSTSHETAQPASTGKLISKANVGGNTSGANDKTSLKELRSAVAPKKRIVSDDHWLSDRDAAKTATTSFPLSKISPVPRETNVYARPGSSKPDAWVRRKSTPGKRNLLSGDKKQVAFEDAGKSAERKDETLDRSSHTTSLLLRSTDNPGQGTLQSRRPKPDPTKDISAPKSAPPKLGKSAEDAPPAPIEPRVTPIRGAWTRKRPPRQQIPYSSQGSSDEDGSGSDIVKNAPPKTFTGRMDAWLSKTPDPFVDELEDPLTGDARPMSISDAGSDIAPRKTSVRRNERRVRSYDGSNTPSQSDSEEHSTQSSPSLRRSGARRTKQSLAITGANGESASKELQLALPPKPSLQERHHQYAEGKASPAKLRRNNGPDSRKKPNVNRTLSSHADLISVLTQSRGVKGIVSARSVRTSRKKLGNATLTDLMNELKSDEAKYIRELRTLVDGVVPVLLNSVLSQANSGSLGMLYDGPNAKDKAKEIIINLGISLERLHSTHKRLPIRDPDAFVSWAQRSLGLYENYIHAWRLGFQDVVINLALADDSQDPTYVSARGDGERVNVAFLLKRPLVRLKYLAKTLKGFDHVQPSDETKSLVSKYQDVVEEARMKQDKEHARMEDEAAANIDATKARDPETLAALSGVRITRNRCVRARDVFDMRMHHSSGQRLDCHVMLFMRDDFSGYGNRGDVLVAEIDSSSRWLLFPPAELPQLSARLGKSKREVVVMLRGSPSVGREWRELMSLEANNDATALEWVKMLGSNPLPPAITASKGFKDVNLHWRDPTKALEFSSPDQRRPSSPSELDVPLGEQSVLSFGSREPATSPQMSHGHRPTPARYHKRNQSAEIYLQNSRDQPAAQPRSIFDNTDTRGQASSAPPSPHHGEPCDSSTRTEAAASKVRGWLSGANQAPGGRLQPNNLRPVNDKDDYAHMDILRKSGSQRPIVSRRLSTVPSEGLLSINRNRGGNWVSLTPVSENIHDGGAPPLRKDSRDAMTTSKQSMVQLRGASTPILGPPTQKSTRRRRSSSPLKYEYEPSSASDTSSVMGEVPSEDNGSVTSESSIDDMCSDPRIPSAALRGNVVRSSFADRYTPKGLKGTSPTRSNFVMSQGSPEQAEEIVRVIASIHTWSDEGMWKLLHPDECSIVVTPGLIEAFEMSAAHSAPGNAVSSSLSIKDLRSTTRPLVALELTPLVPLRQSTAIDITIRSPTTANSQLRAGNNIMFRSRAGRECEYLYNLINQARINNPTYIALQNARGPMGGSNWASYMDQQASRRGASSWWRLGSRKSSYRAGNTRRSVSLAETVSSVASMSSAISALKRFSGSKMFNVGRSTISSRGALSNEKSLSSLESSSGSSTPVMLFPSKGSPAGLTDMKIRLYERETASKWRDMGSARLTIMHPPRENGPLISPTGHVKQEKRILIVGKTRGETLLDVTLGETSFERVARTGIAVKVWEQFDEMGKTGGVAAAKMSVYMIQLKSEAEAAYTFSLVGRLRY